MKTANDINRAANPINNIAVAYWLSVSLESTSAVAYRNRIEKAIAELSSKKDGLWEMGVVMGTPDEVTRISITKPPFIPNISTDRSAYVSLNLVHLAIQFFRKKVSTNAIRR